MFALAEGVAGHDHEEGIKDRREAEESRAFGKPRTADDDACKDKAGNPGSFALFARSSPAKALAASCFPEPGGPCEQVRVRRGVGECGAEHRAGVGMGVEDEHLVV